jgi:hypothetical protein
MENIVFLEADLLVPGLLLSLAAPAHDANTNRSSGGKENIVVLEADLLVSWTPVIPRGLRRTRNTNEVWTRRTLFLVAFS